MERTLFIIDRSLGADMQRRANVGLNKGKAHRALTNALRVGRQGEIRDRTAEGPPQPAGRYHRLSDHRTPRPKSLLEDAQVSTVRRGFSRRSHRLDGHISHSQAGFFAGQPCSKSSTLPEWRST